MNKDFSKLCTPAKIYFAIAVIASLVALYNRYSIGHVFMNLVFAFIWTFILAWLCDKGYDKISWFLVLLPYIIMLFAIFGLYHLTKRQNYILQSTQLQGPFGNTSF
jgi:predicted membrane metal-binding protein